MKPVRQSNVVGGTEFSHHHIHARWQGKGEPGIEWQHDYEQIPQTNRSHLMVHVFFYLDGLNGEVGDLLVLPGSHTTIMSRDAPRMFRFDDLPGSVTIDRLAPGSAIVLHSAIVHARRPNPGGEHYRRYFIDTSYCQAGIRWPGYPGHEAINSIAREQGFDRDGKYRYLYDSSQFFDPHEAWQKMKEINQGSFAGPVA
jgi:ectoine hydroxylase-related dioxygenase (phytanoyl-CoA dioxygenase family)